MNAQATSVFSLVRLVCLGAIMSAGCTSQARWLRGNTHTHTLWSDGDAAPEHAISWYVDHGYDFLVLSDHNVFQDHDKWFTVTTEGGRLRQEHVDELESRFGAGWTELRETEDGDTQMRLKALGELRTEFEDGSFLLVSGEEVTDSFEGKPIHINAVNSSALIKPQGGVSVTDTIQRNLDAIEAHGVRAGRPTLGHVNHPSFQWGITADELAGVRGEHFFEVYNGHRSVRNEGDAEHRSLEAMWDHALTVRLTTTGELLYGLATDDAHNHFDPEGHSAPGRGWVMVWAERFDPDSIVRAMKRGDFYASSGVEIESFTAERDSYRVEIKSVSGVQYETTFIGTRLLPDGTVGPTGETLGVSDENPAVYHFDGSELYVRARVVSTTLHPRPYAAGDFETAWLQPAVRSRLR